MSKFSWKNVLIAGTAAGVVSGLVKLGWENILLQEHQREIKPIHHKNYLNKWAYLQS